VGEPRRVAGAVKQGRRQATAKARNAAPTFPRGAGGQRRRRATMAGLPFVGRLGWTRVPARFWGGGGERQRGAENRSAHWLMAGAGDIRLQV
jgi:hypothetical protein